MLFDRPPGLCRGFAHGYQPNDVTRGFTSLQRCRILYQLHQPIGVSRGFLTLQRYPGLNSALR